MFRPDLQPLAERLTDIESHARRCPLPSLLEAERQGIQRELMEHAVAARETLEIPILLSSPHYRITVTPPAVLQVKEEQRDRPADPEQAASTMRRLAALDRPRRRRMARPLEVQHA